MARYESEITQFLRKLKTARPEIAARQREGRAIWWDKQLDGELQRGFRDSRVAQQPYVYATKSE